MNKIFYLIFLFTILVVTGTNAQQNPIDCDDAYQYLPVFGPGSQSIDTPSVPCGFTPPGSSVYFNQCSPCGRKISDDLCENTPNPTLCDLDGFQTSTGGYSPDLAGIGAGFCNGSGSLENNFWIGFTAQTNELCIEVCIGDCTTGQGIQVAIIETNCVDEFNTMQGGNPCTFLGVPSNGCRTFDANNLVAGNEYYIMVDGFAGDICDMQINVECGFAEADFQVNPILDAVLCPDILNPGEYTPQPGSGAIVDVTVGGAATTDLVFFWLDPNNNLVATTDPTFINGNVVRGELDGSFFTETGTYSVQIVDIGSCCPACDIIELEVAMPPAAAAAVILGVNGTGVLDCNNDMVTLEGNPDDGSIPAVEQWQILNAAGDRVEFLEPNLVNAGNGRINEITITQADIEEFLPGQEEGEVTFIYGFLNDLGQLCYGDADVTFPFDFRKPEPAIDLPEEIDCATNPTVDLIGQFSQIPNGISNGSYSWTFQDGSTNGIVSGANEANAVVGAPGFYTLVVIDDINGCSDSTQVQVLGMVDPPILASIDPDTLNCNNNSLVTLTSTGDAGGSPIDYSWSDDNGPITGETDPTLDVSSPGIYTLTATNTDNGCQSFVSTEVEDDTPILAISELGDSTLTCDKNSIVFPTAIVTDGNDDYEYSWSDGTNEVSNSADYTATEAGTFTLTVTDLQSGCTATQVATVAADENSPQISPLPTDLVLNCTNSEMVSTIADASDNNGDPIPGVTYTWFEEDDDVNPIANTADLDITVEGTYTVLVTNPANGCSSTQDVTVTLDTDGPDAAIAEPDDITCAAMMVTLTGSSMEANVSYQWYEGTDELTGTPLGAAATQDVSAEGDYALVITNTDNGCTTLVTENVAANNTDPTPLIAPPAVLNCTNEMVGITLDGSGSTGDGTLMYTWLDASNMNAGNNATISATEVGIYTLTVTDMDNGCDMTTTVEVMGDFAEPQGVEAFGGTLNCGDDNFVITSNIASTGNYTYCWTDLGNNIYPDGETLTVTSGGTYILTVKDNDNGCSASSTTMVDLDDETPNVLAVLISGDLAPLDCNNPVLVYEGQLDMNDPDVTITWEMPGGMIVNSNQITVDENSPEGEYTVTAFNSSNGCDATGSFTPLFEFGDPEVTASGGTIFCAPNDQVTLTAQSVGADEDADTYEWTNENTGMTFGGNGNTVTATEAGMYTVIGTGDNGCQSAPFTFEISENVDNPTVSVAPEFDLSCRPGEDNYDLGGSATTMNGDPVSYSWVLNSTEISTDANPNITEEGLYTLTVTNTVSNCMETATVQVNDITTDPQAVGNVQMVLNCETPMVLLEGDATDPNATFSWMLDGNPATQIDEQSPMVGMAGDWILTVTSDNGCIGTTSVEVEEDFATPENVMITGDNLLTCADNMVQLMGSTSTMDIQGFEWTLDVNGTYSSTETAPNVSEPGIYTLIVTGDNGCTEMTTFEVTQEVGLPTVSADPQDILTCDITETVILTSSSAANSIYEWDGPVGFIDPGTQDITTTLDGDYSVTITDDDNGCSSVAVATVQINIDEPVVMTQETTVTCEDVPFVISADTDVNGATFEWSGPGTYTADIPNPEVTEAGDYMVTVTDPSNGCTTIEMVTVDEGRDLPDFEFAADIELLTCDNMESIITATSATTGVIITFNENDNTASVEDGQLSVTEPGTVSINFLNPANGCETTQTVVIAQDITAPMPIPNNAVELNCQILESALSITTNEEIRSYEWSGDGTVSSVDAASPTVTEPGFYTVIVTAEDNGCTAQAIVEVTQDMNIPISAPSATEINCNEPIADLIGMGSTEGGDISYEWTGPGGFSSIDLNTTTDLDGEYTLTVTNSTNQCVISETVIVELDDLAPSAEAGIDVDFPCSVTMVTLSGSGDGQGNLSYQWLNEANAEVGTGATIDVSQSGTFTLVVTDDDNGCTSTDTMDVIPDEDKPIIDVAAIDILTCDVTSVSIDASNTTGVGTLDFTWTFDENNTPAGTGAIISVSNPGSYTVLVSDQSNGCNDSFTVNVDQNIEDPEFTLDAGIIDCLTGMADVLVVGLTTTNPSYEWEGPMGTGFTSTDADLIGVTNAGNYSVTITDTVNGCSETATAVVLTDTNAPTATIGNIAELDCDTEEVELVAATSGTGLTYSWSGPGIISGLSELTATVNEPGFYELTITDPSNGCSTVIAANVTENTNVITAIGPDGDDVNCFGPNTGAITLGTNAIVGGTAPYLYSIDGGSSFTTQQDFLGLTAGDYDVVVQDARGCEFDQTITIDPAVDLILELGDDQVIAFGDSLLLSPQTNFDIDEFEWNDSLLMVSTPFVKPVNTTSYEITAFDEDGCITTDFITIFVEKTRPVYIPSGFSPNGDGINDFFTVYVDADLIVGVKNFNVYDRWGETMYAREDLTIDQILNETNGWDGNYRSEGMSPGVFVYHLVVEFIDGEEIFYEGNITLNR